MIPQKQGELYVFKCIITERLFKITCVKMYDLEYRSIFPVSQQTPKPPAGIEPNALEILGERYARGEITREQYEMIKQDLQ